MSHFPIFVNFCVFFSLHPNVSTRALQWGPQVTHGEHVDHGWSLQLHELVEQCRREGMGTLRTLWAAVSSNPDPKFSNPYMVQ